MQQQVGISKLEIRIANINKTTKHVCLLEKYYQARRT
jgi:hypothetical protein